MDTMSVNLALEHAQYATWKAVGLTYISLRNRSCHQNSLVLSDVSPGAGMIDYDLRRSSREVERHILMPNLKMLTALVTFPLHAIGALTRIPLSCELWRFLAASKCAIDVSSRHKIAEYLQRQSVTGYAPYSPSCDTDCIWINEDEDQSQTTNLKKLNLSTCPLSLL